MVIAAAWASPGVAQVCTTATIPPEAVLIEIMQGLISIGGERCTTPCDPCEKTINLATVTGECLTSTDLTFLGKAHWDAVYGCDCNFAKANKSGSLHGQGTLSTLNPFSPGTTVNYTLDRPIVVEIVDCDYATATTFAVLSSLSLTMYVTSDTANIQDPPGLMHGILVTSLSATMAPATICGVDWDVTFLDLDLDSLPLALGLIDVSSGDIVFPANMAVTLTNNIYGPGNDLALYGFIGGHVDVGQSNGLTFTLSLNPDLAVSPADLNVDGEVGIVDFLLLLGAWGPCPPPCPPACGADINGDCAVDVVDFLGLLAAWGSVE